MSLSSILADVRYTLRLLGRSPTYAAAVVLTFALALGANAAVITLVRAILLDPVQVPEPERLVRLFAQQDRRVGIAGTSPARDAGEASAFVYPTYVHLAQATRSFSGLAASFSIPARMEIDRTEHDGAFAALVTPNYFDVTGVGVQRGRGLVAADDDDGAPGVAVLSDLAWRRWFDADPAVLGRVVRTNGVPLTVVGVLTPGFRGLKVGVETDLYVPGALVNRIAPFPGNYRRAGVVDGFRPAACGR